MEVVRLRDRRVQRELARRGIAKLEPKDFCGVTNLTPYYAAEKMRREAIREITKEIKEKDRLQMVSPAEHFHA